MPNRIIPDTEGEKRGWQPKPERKPTPSDGWQPEKSEKGTKIKPPPKKL